MRLFLVKRILLIFIIVLFGVLFLEGATRIFLSNKIIEPAVPSDVGQFDEIHGWSLKPLSYGTSNRTGYKIEYHINSKGLRDDETSYEKPDGTFRIALIGDSRTFGFGVPIEKHYSTLLEGYFQNVEVINMGVGGYGVDQQLLTLRSKGFRYEPDLVLSYVAHYNDHRHIHTERWGKQKPRFILIDGELVLTNSPVVYRPPSTLRKIHRWFRKHSKTYEIFRNGLVGLISQESNANQQIQGDKDNLGNEAFKNELYDLGEAIIYATHQESIENGATFVLVTSIDELYEASLGKHILTLDITKPLGNPKFWLPDNLYHINESGNGVLAWEIAEFLQTNQLIPIKYLKAKNRWFTQ